MMYTHDVNWIISNAMNYYKNILHEALSHQLECRTGYFTVLRRNNVEQSLYAMSTHHLLDMLKTARVGGWVDIDGVSVDPDMIKTVLATRPHIPNKAERKKARAKAAKT